MSPRIHGTAAVLLAMAAVWTSACTCAGAPRDTPGEAAPPLEVREIQPPEAPAGGGQFAALVGSGFDPRRPVQVRFGDVAAPRSAVISAERIQVEIPPGQAGRTVDVHVIQSGRSASVQGAFTYRPEP